VPTATSLRVLPVKMLTEDDIVNTHLLEAWRTESFIYPFYCLGGNSGFKEFPNINSYYANQEGTHYRVKPGQVNLGIAVDLESQRRFPQSCCTEY
jgi:multifunctional 2-oxoglutarate metabolism enzyme